MATKKKAKTSTTTAPRAAQREGADCILSLAEACEYAGVKSERFLREELSAGKIAGRNIGGQVGWITTRSALLAWAMGVDANGPSLVGEEAIGVDGAMLRTYRAHLSEQPEACMCETCDRVRRFDVAVRDARRAAPLAPEEAERVDAP